MEDTKVFYSFINTSISEYEPIPEGADQYPVEYIENNHVIKLKEDSNRVFIGICDPENIMLVEDVRNYHRKKVVFYRVDKSELTSYLAKLFSNAEDAEGRETNTHIDEKVLLDRLANDAPVINLVNSILIDAIRKEASDIHIEAFSDYVIVRYRLDGELHTVKRFDKGKFRAITTRIKIMANLNIMERRLPQDGRLTVHIDGDMVDIRVSLVPVTDGESIVLRLFNKKRSPLTIEHLGLSSEGIKSLYRIINLHNGLVLATGPTGSGKTTTLNDILKTIKSESLKIISIEDPVEYKIDGVNQIQTNEKIGLTFDKILRRVLRQDPNVIMIGEIRDLITAQLVIRAALTGHLVLST
ncbi:MAG: type II/IV secretion system protein, partial [Spirochaetes bacterium]|nr:type II/IV secretion system protein [Spirochaetota bacterium]